MSQNSLTLPITGTVSGLQMTQNINNALDTLNTLSSGASMPSSPEAGQLWHDTGNSLLKIRSYDNSCWITLLALNESAYLSSPAYAAQATGEVNRVLNGGMLIDQVNEGGVYSVPVTGAMQYAADQWAVACTSSASGVTAQRVSDAPPGFSGSLKVTVNTGAGSVAAGDSLNILQLIEANNINDLAIGSGNASPLSLSFWVKSSVAGTFSVTLGNLVAAPRQLVATFTITAVATWQKVTIANLPGDSSGSWATNFNAGFSLSFVLACGSGGQTAILNSWQNGAYLASPAQTNTLLTTSGATFQLTGVMFNAGAFCLPFEKRSIMQEILSCERYYQKSFPQGTSVGQNNGYGGAFGIVMTGSGAFGVTLRTRVPMRVSPTLVTYNPLASNANWHDVSGGDLNANAFILGGDSVALYGTSGTASQEARIHYSLNARM